MYFKKMIGEKVYLSPQDSGDALLYVEWLNNYDVSKYVDQHVKNINLNSEREYLEKNESDRYNFAIVDKETDKLIGSIGLSHVKNIHRTAELGIFIGDTNYLSHGYGSDAIKLLLDFAFNQLNLNNIMLKAISNNKRALKAYSKCGFKEFGVWEKSHFYDGQYYDLVYMNITRDDFNNK